MIIDGVNFSLSGIVVHAGRSSNAGHYYTIAKSGQKWFLCNDSSVSQLGGGAEFDIGSYVNRSIGGSFASDTPYMLNYERLQAQGEDQEMTEEPSVPETPRLDPTLRAYIEQDAQLFKKEIANARRF